VKAENAQLTPVDTSFSVRSAPADTTVKVSAYLIYDDGSISSFDILNDKTKALWNTNIGADDVQKPSTSTKVLLTGHLADLSVKVFNGKKKVVDQPLPTRDGEQAFIIKNTGCDIVKVTATKQGKTVFEDSILFECGE
jgi:archaellum component FlaG (FlaF/FlaG flagellin family)